ncbi:uncharacterized protein LOC108960623 [Eucalyptus grandis]|uniref:uncharacterized protein LOC108960623 n=1 Tax=Eucalyptus grandis TaxID=71139 RepID=UPI00192EF0B3|nr:uncharacterized protein LOC108960623 [Eucalyptus grandis]
MRKLAEKQICALLPVKTSKFNIRVMVASLVFAGFTSSGFLPLPVKIPLLALSAVFFVASFLKKKKAVDQSAARHENLALHHIGMVDRHFQQQTQQVAESDGEGSASQMVKLREESLNFPAGGESSDELIESGTFEPNFISSNNRSCGPLVCSSEDDDDDDGSLIEISLPGNVCSDDISTRFVVEKQEATEILTDDEINEEDSLLELDISMGSIRCSKF